MAVANHARTERAALCDLLLQLGPDAPTLCAGWSTRDLAAHLVLRERRLDAAPGILISQLGGYTARVQSALAAQPYDRLVDQVRRPPAWTPMTAIPALDRAVNTMEFFIHHEDVRRAQPVWQPRQLPPDLTVALWKRVRAMSRLALRKVRVPVILAAPGLGEARVGAGDPAVRVTGAPAELVMYVTGRTAAAKVEVTGPPELVDQLRAASFGL